MKNVFILIFLLLPLISSASLFKNKLSADEFICQQLNVRYIKDNDSVTLSKLINSCSNAAWANVNNFHSTGDANYLNIATAYASLPLQYEATPTTYKLYDTLGAINIARNDFKSAEVAYKKAKQTLKNRPEQFDIYINYAINSQDSLLKSFHGISWGTSPKANKNLKFQKDIFLGKSYILLNDMDSFLHYDTSDIQLIFKNDKFIYVNFYLPTVNTVKKFKTLISETSKFYNIEPKEELSTEQLIGYKFHFENGSQSVVMQLYFGVLDGNSTTLVLIDNQKRQ